MFRLLIFLAAAGAALAQTATGIIEGRVSDASGGAVPEAKVAIENERTRVRQQLLTNSEGRFVQPYLLPGTYRVSAEKPGFEKYVTSGIKLDVQQTVALELALKVGEITTAVEVRASTVHLATSTSSVATVIANKAILDLPLNGRNPFSLATLTPGVIPGAGSTPWISGGRKRGKRDHH